MREACSAYQDKTIRGIKSRRVQCDEIWSFVGAKEKNTTPETKAAGWGDCWTWTALDADSKLIISFMLGDRTLTTAHGFMADVAGRLANRVQLTTDGRRPHLAAVKDAFGDDIDYAMLLKVYGADNNPKKRYSPAVCLGCTTQEMTGARDLWVSNSLSGGSWELDEVPALGDPTHIAQIGWGRRESAGERQRRVALQ